MVGFGNFLEVPQPICVQVGWEPSGGLLPGSHRGADVGAELGNLCASVGWVLGTREAEKRHTSGELDGMFQRREGSQGK